MLEGLGWLAPPWALQQAAAGGLLPLALLVALAADRLWGEPPLRWHPVVWMGRALEALGRRIAPAAPTGRDMQSFWLAALAWSALAAMVLVVAALLQALLLWTALPAPGRSGAALPPAWLGSAGPGGAGVLHAVRWLLAALLLGLLLKPLLALALLQSEVRAVEAALAESLDAGRARLAWLVSRDVAQLTADEVRQSAIESLAENLNDSVVAPLFWFALLACRARRCTAWPTRPTPCGATPTCAGRATGNGPANGPRAPTMCCRGCRRA